MKNILQLIIFFFFFTGILSTQVLGIDIDAKELIRTPTDRFYDSLRTQGIVVKYNSDGYGLLEKNNMKGIAFKEQIIIPIVYTWIYNLFKTEKEVIIVQKDGKYNLLNRDNKVVGNKYDYMSSVLYHKDLYIAKLNQKYVIVNSSGKECSRLYDEIKEADEDYFIALLEGKYGIINTLDKVVIPFEYDDIYYSFFQSKIKAKKIRYGIINFSNETIIPFQYDNINPIDEEGGVKDAYIVELYDKKGIIDAHNNFIIAPVYEGFRRMGKSYIVAIYEGKLGVIDWKGNVVIPFDYNGLYKFDNKDRFRVSKDRLWGIIDAQNNLLIPFMYKKISGYSFESNNEYSSNSYIYKVSQDGKKYFIVNEKNQIIVE